MPRARQAFSMESLTLSSSRSSVLARKGSEWSTVGTRDPDSSAADNHYSAAMALAEELGMRPLVAHCHLGLGKLYRRTGKRAQAQAHLTTATTLYREMGMTYWLEQAEAELQALVEVLLRICV
jgi:hypothetical protein